MARRRRVHHEQESRITIFQTFISGGIAGVVARTATSPLDVVKIMAQVGTKPARAGLIPAFQHLYRTEGWRSFWKGNGVACLRLLPYNALQFAFFEQFKRWMSDQPLSTRRLTWSDSLVAGSLAGMCATVLTYPMDLVKTRLTVMRIDPQHAKYKGIWDAFRTIAREETVVAFYKGMGTSMLGIIPFAGGTFVAYELIESLWNKPRSMLSPGENFLNGCLAATIAQTASFPFDTIRKKLQAQSLTVPVEMRPDVEFNGMLDAFVKTFRAHGWRGLWSGYLANLLKVAPYTGLMFASYEACKRVCLYENGYTESPFTDRPRPGVPQNLTPEKLREWRARFEGRPPA